MLGVVRGEGGCSSLGVRAQVLLDVLSAFVQDWCASSVLVVSVGAWWCPGGVCNVPAGPVGGSFPVMSHVWLRGASSVTVVWCFGGVPVVFWCFGGGVPCVLPACILVVTQCLPIGVPVVSQHWCFGALVFWWCSGALSAVSRCHVLVVSHCPVVSRCPACVLVVSW